MFVGVVIVLIAAAVVFAFLPARAHDVREEVEGPLDGLASLTWAEAEGALELDTAEEEGLVAPLGRPLSGDDGTRRPAATPGRGS